MKNFIFVYFLGALVILSSCRPVSLLLIGARTPKVESISSARVTFGKLQLADSLVVFPKDLASYKQASSLNKHAQLRVYGASGFEEVYFEEGSCTAPNFSLAESICSSSFLRVDSTKLISDEFSLYSSFGERSVLQSGWQGFGKVVFISYYGHNRRYNRSHLKEWAGSLQQAGKECKVKLVLVCLDVLDTVAGRSVTFKEK